MALAYDKLRVDHSTDLSGSLDGDQSTGQSDDLAGTKVVAIAAQIPMRKGATESARNLGIAVMTQQGVEFISVPRAQFETALCAGCKRTPLLDLT